MIIFEGKSQLDGQPIVVIATKGSRNTKTGDMVQTWIMRQDTPPIEAVKTGKDSSVCGNCPLRGDKGKKRACYVKVFQAPNSIWKKYKAGGYKKAETAEDRARFIGFTPLRFGAYGDPAAVPKNIWDDCLKYNDQKFTGYSHQWAHKTADFRPDQTMASVESLDQAKKCWEKGWRTFRIISDVSEKSKNEIICPASDEGGKKTNCAFCQLCSGTSSKAKKSVAVVAHGIGAKYV